MIPIAIIKYELSVDTAKGSVTVTPVTDTASAVAKALPTFKRGDRVRMNGRIRNGALGRVVEVYSNANEPTPAGSKYKNKKVRLPYPQIVVAPATGEPSVRYDGNDIRNGLVTKA